MLRLQSILAVIALLLAFACVGFSQAVTASVVGTITDATGAAVPNAKVTITEVNTGVGRTSTTNESGNYSFPDLPPGVYKAAAEVTGFKRAESQNVTVLVNTTVRIDLRLEPGNITETISVTAEAATLQTERADTSAKIDSTSIANLPLGGSHNFQSLSILIPGAARPTGQHSAFFNPQVSLATRFNGQSRLANNLELEGVDDNERTGLLQVLIPPQEAIQTVDISTSDYDAELGRATGGAINVILKSGTNEYHGSAYEWNRVSALASRNFFDPSRGHFTYNYFGGTIGGPIRKNKTFFFGDYLRIEDHSANNFRETVPTAAERAGDLTGSRATIYDPATANADGTVKQPLPGNIVPASRINPLSQKILGVITPQNTTTGGGTAAQPTQNLFLNLPFYRNTDQFDVKVDHNQTDKDRFSVRYSYSRPVTVAAAAYGIYGGPAGVGGSGFTGTGTQGTHSGAINYDHIFSPTLLTEVRAGVNRYRNDAQEVDFGHNASADFGIPGISVSDWTSGPPQIEIGGFSGPVIGFSASLPWIRSETNILLTNVWTKTAGNHSIKFGFDFRRVRDDLQQTQTFNPRGRFNFGSAQTSLPGKFTDRDNSMASFLLDVPSEVGRDFPVFFPAYRAWQYFLFVGDKWTVTPKLTVDIGLRWEYYPPATPAHTAGFSQYDPVNDALVISGLGNNPMDFGMHHNYHDFAPRLGVAYRINDKTVVRSGFGMSYAPFPDNTYAYNYPVKQNNDFVPACGSGCFLPAILPNGQIASFQAGFPPFQTVAIPPNGIIQSPSPNQTYFFINPLFREPYVESWNAAVQRSLPKNFTLDIAYVGNHGVDQPAVWQMNAGQVLGAANAGRPLYQRFGHTNSVEDRYIGLGSMYNALQIKFDRRFSNGFQLTTAYTYSKAEGFQSEDSGLSQYIDVRRDWRQLDFNRTHYFVQSYVYQLPFGKGKKYFPSGVGSAILGGWQVNGILSLATGTPMTFGGDSGVLKAPQNGNTLNWFGPNKIDVTHGTGRGNTWFTPSICNFNVAKGPLASTNCFAQPGAENGGQPEFGNLGWNVLDGPGFWNLDASVFRTFTVTERVKLELRGEAFSVVNTPQWNNPDTGIGSSTFGQITGAGGSRTIQFAAKVMF